MRPVASRQAHQSAHSGRHPQRAAHGLGFGAGVESAVHQALQFRGALAVCPATRQDDCADVARTGRRRGPVQRLLECADCAGCGGKPGHARPCPRKDCGLGQTANCSALVAQKVVAAEADKARAVGAERERCAQVADSHAELLEDAMKQAKTHESHVIMSLDTAARHARQIAAAIHTGAKP